MRDVIVVGDGPTGLSAALLLAKNGLDVEVFGEGDTRMHNAHLTNYLGVESIDGSAFMTTARQQCEAMGAVLTTARVTGVERTDAGFQVTTADGDTREGAYLVLATGNDRGLAADVGVETAESERFHDEQTVAVDRRGRTSVEGVYAGGWTTRVYEIQAAISVGDGAAIALDILSRESDKPFHDFDAAP
ncbi:FAD-dependent oxidoreductase [Halobacteriaceae archaeon GCM10025711]